MSLFGKVEGAFKSLAMTAEHFFGGLENEVADTMAPYLAKIRVTFTDDLGYLMKGEWAYAKAAITDSIKRFAPQYAGNPIGLIGAVFQDLCAQAPSALSVAEQLALHGLISAMVAAL